jgi:hypothetical protein
MGARKTHILCTLGVIERGIVLIFIPLLRLSADIMLKFTCTNQRFGAIIIETNKHTRFYWSNARAFFDLP